MPEESLTSKDRTYWKLCEEQQSVESGAKRGNEEACHSLQLNNPKQMTVLYMEQGNNITSIGHSTMIQLQINWRLLQEFLIHSAPFSFFISMLIIWLSRQIRITDSQNLVLKFTWTYESLDTLDVK